MHENVDRSEPDATNGYQSRHADLILSAFLHYLGYDLLDCSPVLESPAERLYHVPFVVLAHDSATDPVFFYGNLAAQRLFELSWDELVQLPSRFSAEPLAQEERQLLLDRVARAGYIDDYAGVRISKRGKRFFVSGAVVWNLLDSSGAKLGQAATFSQWQML